MGGALVDPSIRKYVRPLIEARWSPVILNNFFTSYLGKDRPIVKIKSLEQGREFEISLHSGTAVKATPELLDILLGHKKIKHGGMWVREGNYFDEVDYKSWVYQVGYAGPKISLYPEMSVEQNWHYFAKQYGLTHNERKIQVHNTARRLGLGPYIHWPLHQLPAGVRRLADLGAALMHDPKVLCVDVSGIDENIMPYYMRVVMEEKQKGNCVVVAGSNHPSLQ